MIYKIGNVKIYTDMRISYADLRISRTSQIQNGYIDVADGCWRPNVLVTRFGCW